MTIPAMTSGFLSGDFFGLVANEFGKNTVDGIAEGTAVKNPGDRVPVAPEVVGRSGSPSRAVVTEW